jgi:hypothetical protein
MSVGVDIRNLSFEGQNERGPVQTGRRLASYSILAPLRGTRPPERPAGNMLHSAPAIQDVATLDDNRSSRGLL